MPEFTIVKNAVAVEDIIAFRQAFSDFVNRTLRKYVDYGQLPGVDKPYLTKAGAEKILQFFNAAPVFDILMHEQDRASGYLYVEILAKAVVVGSDVLIGTGVGACSSYESRYRWRREYWNGRGQPPEGEGWVRGYDKARRREYYYRRAENPDLIDTWNTVLKMAKKRALVDLALSISGASEMFTQDVEDMEFPLADDAPAPEPAPNDEVDQTKPTRPFEPEHVRQLLHRVAAERYPRLVGVRAQDEVNKKRLGLLVGKMSEALGGDDEGTRMRHAALSYLFGVKSSGELDVAQVSAMLDWLVGERDEETGHYTFKEHAVAELHAIARRGQEAEAE